MTFVSRYRPAPPNFFRFGYAPPPSAGRSLDKRHQTFRSRHAVFFLDMIVGGTDRVAPRVRKAIRAARAWRDRAARAGSMSRLRPASNLKRDAFATP
ncbi:hypothetical protein OWS73_15100 [Burkholderia sp. 1B3(2022)]|uniref:hypothetical protein n=1 Tax=Burkholderia sp. 1B3(2022) TaxID=2997425 RepID=UPI002FC5EAFA